MITNPDTERAATPWSLTTYIRNGVLWPMVHDHDQTFSSNVTACWHDMTDRVSSREPPDLKMKRWKFYLYSFQWRFVSVVTLCLSEYFLQQLCLQSVLKFYYNSLLIIKCSGSKEIILEKRFICKFLYSSKEDTNSSFFKFYLVVLGSFIPYGNHQLLLCCID